MARQSLTTISKEMIMNSKPGQFLTEEESILWEEEQARIKAKGEKKNK
jgi:hypothetical protein